MAAVRQEVEFFNNYLLDAKRPSPPENKPLPPVAQGEERSDARREVDTSISLTYLLLLAPPNLPGFPAQAPQQQSLLGYPPGVRPPMPAFPGMALVM